ncbi:aromatic compound dioxygenase [Phlebopus sp. FC_14]|nr:aromatic compound dioxygenase [Phlebopus sp. FC_14]
MGDHSEPESTNVQTAVYNGIPPPSSSYQFLPDKPETITANLLKLLESAPNPRHKFILQVLVKHLHAVIIETNLTTGELFESLKFLVRVGQTCTPSRDEMSLLSAVVGVNVLVDAIENPVADGATESCLQGPFYYENAQEVDIGGSIASEGSGDYLYVEGRVLTTKGEPIQNAIIDAWGKCRRYGLYDVHYVDQTNPDCRGRVRSGKDGEFGFRVAPPYPADADGPVGELMLLMGLHNMRPSHVHLMVKAPGYRTLVTAFYPEDSDYLTSDIVFGVKKSLVVKLRKVEDDEEACKRGLPNGSSFMLLQRDIVSLTEEQAKSL